MYGFDEEYDRAEPSRAFDDDTALEIFRRSWCEACVHNEAGREVGCPLLLVIAAGRRPRAIVHVQSQTLAAATYCTQFSPT